MTMHEARFDQLTAHTLYTLLKLRTDVFVVEQNCPYPELDGRDDEPGTIHLWIAERETPLAYLRLLTDPDGSRRIGRVVTAPRARGRGLAADLVRAALDRTAGAPCVLDAQSHLVAFYERFGFVKSGPEYVEDGIPHVPMRREAA